MYQFTSEYVAPGHPDKVADAISDAIVDEFISNDPDSRVACETMVAGTNVVLGGEISSKHHMSDERMSEVVDAALTEIGYKAGYKFGVEHAISVDNVDITNHLREQSPDIAQGVHQEDGEYGAGDQGMMLGFASSETESRMPAALDFSKAIGVLVYLKALEDDSIFGVDIKTQVTVNYEDRSAYLQGKAHSIDTIIISAPTLPEIGIEEVRRQLKDIVLENADTIFEDVDFDADSVKWHLNPTGRYVTHSSIGDCGITGRKIVVDQYGARCPVGGGAFSGKDYTKVDRSAAYAARWIATNLVQSGVCSNATVQLAYAIGVAEPVSIFIEMDPSAKVSGKVLAKAIQEHVSLTPKFIKERFEMCLTGENPFSYRDLAIYGHFGLEHLPWEQYDLDLQKAIETVYTKTNAA